MSNRRILIILTAALCLGGCGKDSPETLKLAQYNIDILEENGDTSLIQTTLWIETPFKTFTPYSTVTELRDPSGKLIFSHGPQKGTEPPHEGLRESNYAFKVDASTASRIDLKRSTVNLLYVSF
jgi:hypothetical protein